MPVKYGVVLSLQLFLLPYDLRAAICTSLHIDFH